MSTPTPDRNPEPGGRPRPSSDPFLVLAEHLDEGVLVLEAGNVVWSNPVVSDLLRQGRETLAGQSLHHLIDAGSGQNLPADPEELYAQTHAGEGGLEVAFRRPQAPAVWVSLYALEIAWQGRPAELLLLQELNDQKWVAEKMRAELHLALTLNAAATLSEVLQVSADLALPLTGMDGQCVFIHDPERQGFRLLHAAGVTPDAVQALGALNEHADILERLRSGQAVYAGPEAVGLTPDPKQAEPPLAGLVLAPLRHQDQLLGFLVLGSRTVPTPPLYQRRRIETLAALVGYALVRMLIENELRESELKFRTLAEETLDAVALNIEGKIAWVNKASVEMTGFSEAELIGQPVEVLYASGEAKLVQQRLDDRLAGKPAPTHYESVLKRKDGRLVIQDIFARVITLQGKKAVLVVSRDITQRKQNEDALALAQFSLDHSVVPAYWIAPDSRILYANEAACSALGYSKEEMLAMTVSDFNPDYPPKVWRAYWQELLTHRTMTFETVHRNRQGEVFPVEVSTTLLEFKGDAYDFAFAVDLRERKHAEAEQRSLQEKMLQTQKLESLGVLAGGIAHDFNNLLMGIMGHTSLLLLEQPEGSPAQESLLRIESEARRAAELTNQLLAYAGKGRFQIQRVDLTWLVADTVDLLKISISKKARLLCQLEKGLPGVEAEPTQLRQVVMNLVTNASDALGDQEGAVTVRTGSREMTATELAGLYTSDPLEPGTYVVLEVIDTGSGMDEETKARIFDPFFTTKFTGRGLGLAAVLGIVRNHHGGIQVISAPRQGTTFRVLLPASTAPAPAVPARTEPHPPRTGQGRILVVDDEPVLRAVLERMLATAGFEVVIAANGHEALDRVRGGRPAFDLVLLDLTMPELDGFETFREIHRVRPELKVILTSGYSEPEALEKFGGEKLAGFIEKPFRIEDLLAKIHAVLPATASVPGAPRSGPVPSGAHPAPKLHAGHKPGKPRAHRGRTGGAGHGRA